MSTVPVLAFAVFAVAAILDGQVVVGILLCLVAWICWLGKDYGGSGNPDDYDGP